MRKAVTMVLLVTALLFGFTTCDGGFTDGNTFDNGMGGGGGGGLGGLGGRLSFRSGTPPSSSGLSSAQFNAINKASGGGYKGYSFMSMPMRSAGGAGDGYQGYSGADNTNSRASYGSIGILYACWENRQTGNFASMIQAAESQTGVPCNVSLTFDESGSWLNSLNGNGGESYKTYLGDLGFNDFHVAVGVDENVYKVWWLMWVKNANSYLGASFKAGDLLFVYMDLSKFMAQYGY